MIILLNNNGPTVCSENRTQWEMRYADSDPAAVFDWGFYHMGHYHRNHGLTPEETTNIQQHNMGLVLDRMNSYD